MPHVSLWYRFDSCRTAVDSIERDIQYRTQLMLEARIDIRIVAGLQNTAALLIDGISPSNT